MLLVCSNRDAFFQYYSFTLQNGVLKLRAYRFARELISMRYRIVSTLICFNAVFDLVRPPKSAPYTVNTARDEKTKTPEKYNLIVLGLISIFDLLFGQFFSHFFSEFLIFHSNDRVFHI